MDNKKINYEIMIHARGSLEWIHRTAVEMQLSASRVLIRELIISHLVYWYEVVESGWLDHGKQVKKSWMDLQEGVLKFNHDFTAQIRAEFILFFETIINHGKKKGDAEFWRVQIWVVDFEVMSFLKYLC